MDFNKDRQPRDRNSRDRNRSERPERRFDRQVVTIRRVAKVTAGGKRMRFSAMVVVGDKKGSVGVGLGRGVDTKSAVEKGARIAEKKMKKIQLIGDTIPHEISVKNGASKVMLRPAKLGTGIIAGSSVRTVLEACGIENVYGKILGSNDLVANTYTAFEALTQLRSARILKNMTKMQERVGIKEQMDAERKVKEKASRAKGEGRDGRRDDRRGDRRGGRDNRGFSPRGANNGPKAAAKSVKDVKAVEKSADTKEK